MRQQNCAKCGVYYRGCKLNSKVFSIVVAAGVSCASLNAAPPVIKVTDDWKSKIEKIAPAEPTVKPKAKRRVLVCSLATGYKHWVIPNTLAMLEILGKKSGAFEVVNTKDIMMFAPDKIKKFDAVVLNNTCSKRDHRNLFLDVLGKENKDKVDMLEKSLLDYVKNGGGLVAIHGGGVTFNGCPEITDMMGGAFDFHLPQQEMVIKPVDADHPITKAFGGRDFVHVDEPYMFKGAYANKDFHPLLVVDTSKLKCGNKRNKILSDVRYASWIKRYGKGRMFFVSPSHNAQSFSDPRLLKFYLNGIQYALGDLECDDTPLKKEDVKKIGEKKAAH